ncbi:hypothetical protein ACFLV4_06110 [Chloroflexota bacterium]
MEERKKEIPYQRFTLKRQDKRVTVNYSAGDYKVLSHMAEKEHKTIVEMAHELFTLGLECKLHQHKRRIAELEGKKQGIPSGDGLPKTVKEQSSIDG